MKPSNSKRVVAAESNGYLGILQRLDELHAEHRLESEVRWRGSYDQLLSLVATPFAHPDELMPAVVEMARDGYPGADYVLRGVAAAAMAADRFPRLPACVQAYIAEAVMRAPLLNGCPSQTLRDAVTKLSEQPRWIPPAQRRQQEKQR